MEVASVNTTNKRQGCCSLRSAEGSSRLSVDGAARWALESFLPFSNDAVICLRDVSLEHGKGMGEAVSSWFPLPVHDADYGAAMEAHSAVK